MSLSSRATWLVLLLASRLAFAAPPPRVKQPESPAEERRRWVRERPVVDFDMGYAVGVGLRHAPSTHDDVDPVLFNSLWSTFTLQPMAFMDRRIGVTFGVDWAEIALFIHGGLVYQHPCTEQLTAYGGFSVGGAPGVDLFREVNIGLEGGLKYYPDPDFHLQFSVLSTVDAPFEFRIGAGSNALYMGIPAYAIAGIAFGVWLTTLDHH